MGGEHNGGVEVWKEVISAREDSREEPGRMLLLKEKSWEEEWMGLFRKSSDLESSVQVDPDSKVWAGTGGGA